MFQDEKRNVRRMLRMSDKEPLSDELTELVERAERLLANRSNQRTFAFSDLAVLLAAADAPAMVDKARRERKKELDKAMKDQRWDDVLYLCAQFPTDLPSIQAMQAEARKQKSEAERARMEAAISG